MRKRTIMPWVGLLVLGLALMSGCGASKAYVDKSVTDERAGREAADAALDKDVMANKAVLERLQALTAQLEKKTDLAINKAAGFENYQVVWEGEIFFDYNADAITVAAQEILDQAGDKMTAYRSSVMEIAGYTDPNGPLAYNMELGQRRAAAAKYHLVDNYGVNLYRIFIVSYGENKSVASAETSPAYAKQRKVVLKLWDAPAK